MSTLEKFGILVILILVVIIGVVAVWGVGGGDRSPFDSAAPADTVASAGGAGSLPEGKPAETWPPPVGGPANPPPVAGAPSAGPVEPPAVKSPVTPPVAPDTARSAAPSGTTYTIKKGDTLAAIAQRTLGDRNKWPMLVDANPGLDPRRLKIGAQVVIPSGTAVALAPAPKIPVDSPKVTSFRVPNGDDGPTEPSAPAATGAGAAPAAAGADAGREVEVRSGDTLYEIARRELNDPNLYYKILKANPGLDPKRLRVGQRIRLPAAE